jgi:hypothetical protein
MMGNEFVSVDHMAEMGETLFCVYFVRPIDVKKSINYMKWKGFRADLVYECGEVVVLYQEERFIPELSTDDNFHKVLNEDNIWEKCPSGSEYDYHYRVVSDRIICVSFISTLINAKVT